MPDQQRVRNVSVYGDLEVPELGIIIPFQHEAVVDATIAESLIAAGNFVAVNRAGDADAELTGVDAPPITTTTPAPLNTNVAAGADATPNADSTATATDSEEKNQ